MRRRRPRAPRGFPCSSAAVTAGIAVLAAVPSVACSQESVLLRLAPETGLVSRYVTEVEARFEGESLPGVAPGEPVATGRIWVTQTVTEAAGETRAYEIVIDSAGFDTPSMPGMAETLPDLRGIRQTLRMSTRGEVLEMSVQGQDLPPGFEETMSQVGGVAGAASLQLPEGPIGVGESWTARHSVDVSGAPIGGLTMELEVTYRLDRVEDRGESRLAFLTAEGPMTLSSANPATEPQVSGFQSGSVVIDLGLGRVHESDVEMRMEFSMGAAEITSIQSISMRLIER